MCLDGIGVDAVVDFRQFSLRRPSNKLLFLILKALKLLYKIQLEGHANSRAKFKGDVLMSVSAPVPSALNIQSYCVGSLYPFGGTQNERG